MLHTGRAADSLFCCSWLAAQHMTQRNNTTINKSALIFLRTYQTFHSIQTSHNFIVTCIASNPLTRRFAVAAGQFYENCCQRLQGDAQYICSKNKPIWFLIESGICYRYYNDCGCSYILLHLCLRTYVRKVLPVLLARKGLYVRKVRRSVPAKYVRH